MSDYWNGFTTGLSVGVTTTLVLVIIIGSTLLK